MTNEVLLAIPLFIFMGVMLERSRIAEELLETMGRLFGTLRGGLGISVADRRHAARRRQGRGRRDHRDDGPDRAADHAAPRLRQAARRRHRRGDRDAGADFSARDRAGAARRSALNAYQAAQLSQGNFAPSSVTVSDLFAGAIVPGFALVALYILYLIGMAVFFPKTSPAIPPEPGAPRGFALARRLIEVLVAPLLLILAVLGSILGGIATPTEAASVGAVGAILLAARKQARSARRSARWCSAPRRSPA